jgi:hypothetical protein
MPRMGGISVAAVFGAHSVAVWNVGRSEDPRACRLHPPAQSRRDTGRPSSRPARGQALATERQPTRSSDAKPISSDRSTLTWRQKVQAHEAVRDSMEGKLAFLDVPREVNVPGADLQLDVLPNGGVCGASQIRLLEPGEHLQSYQRQGMIEMKHVVFGRCPFINQRVEDKDGQIPLVPIGEYSFGLGYEILGYYPGITPARTHCRHVESPSPSTPSLHR